MRCETRCAAIQLTHFLWARAAGRTVKILREIGFGHSELIQPFGQEKMVNSEQWATFPRPRGVGTGTQHPARIYAALRNG